METSLDREQRLDAAQYREWWRQEFSDALCIATNAAWNRNNVSFERSGPMRFTPELDVYAPEQVEWRFECQGTTDLKQLADALETMAARLRERSSK